MANVGAIDVVNEKDATAATFMVGTDEFAVPLGNMIDVEAEIAKQEAQLKHLEGFLAGIKKSFPTRSLWPMPPRLLWPWSARSKKTVRKRLPL